MLYKGSINDLRDAAKNAHYIMINEGFKHIVYAYEQRGEIYVAEWQPLCFKSDKDFEDYVKTAQGEGVGIIYAVHNFKN